LLWKNNTEIVNLARLSFERSVLIREVFCVPQHGARTDQLWKEMVDVKLCEDARPSQETTASSTFQSNINTDKCHTDYKLYLKGSQV